MFSRIVVLKAYFLRRLSLHAVFELRKRKEEMTEDEDAKYKTIELLMVLNKLNKVASSIIILFITLTVVLREYSFTYLIY